MYFWETHENKVMSNDKNTFKVDIQSVLLVERTLNINLYTMRPVFIHK